MSIWSRKFGGAILAALALALVILVSVSASVPAPAIASEVEGSTEAEKTYTVTVLWDGEDTGATIPDHLTFWFQDTSDSVGQYSGYAEASSNWVTQISIPADKTLATYVIGENAFGWEPADYPTRVQYLNVDEDAMTIEFMMKPATVTIEASWPQGETPLDSVTVALIDADGSVHRNAESLTLDSQNGWSTTAMIGYFGRQGAQILSESDDWTISNVKYSTSIRNGIILEFSKATPDTSLAVNVVWDAAGSTDAVVPSETTVTVDPDGADAQSAALTAEGSWSSTLTFPAGTQITADNITAEQHDWWIPEVSVADGTATVTYTYTRPQRTIGAEVRWSDGTEADAGAPVSLELVAYEGTANERVAATLNLDGSEAQPWQATFDPVDSQLASGEPITYTLRAPSVEGYETPTVTGDADSGFVVSYEAVKSEEPTEPTGPVKPAEPATPDLPEEPAESATPDQSEESEQPAAPEEPAQPEQPATPAQPTVSTTTESAQASPSTLPSIPRTADATSVAGVAIAGTLGVALVGAGIVAGRRSRQQ